MYVVIIVSHIWYTARYWCKK